MFFEHKALYRSLSSLISDDYFTIPLGQANILKEGNDITIVTYGMGVHWALDVLRDNSEISADLIDLRTLVPLDQRTIYNSVKKTGKVIILHEDCLTGGFGADIASMIADECFEYLDAPIKRSASLDTPVPFALDLENIFLAKKRFESQLKDLLLY